MADIHSGADFEGRERAVVALALALRRMKSDLKHSSSGADVRFARTMLDRIELIGEQFRNEATARWNVYSIRGARKGVTRARMDQQRLDAMDAADILLAAVARAQEP